MLAKRIHNATHAILQRNDNMHTATVYLRYDDARGLIQSVWEPTTSELELLNKGGVVVLSVSGNMHPPVDVAVEPHLTDEPA